MRMPMTWRHCEVGRKPGGQPTIELHGSLKDWCAKKQLSAHVSLSDESDYATSYVIVEQAQT
jgi:phosphopantetheinyl transferase (holo-ACP synthase)